MARRKSPKPPPKQPHRWQNFEKLTKLIDSHSRTHTHLTLPSLLSALMRFSMDLHLSPSTLVSLAPLERNSSKQISIVNDIYSWEKELRSWQLHPEEGSVLCTAVKILADGTNLGIESAKRVLWAMAREWEGTHEELVKERLREGEGGELVELYMKGLEYQMSGNEVWSRETLRYHDLENEK